MVRITTAANWGLIYLKEIEKANISCLFSLTYDDDLEMQVAVFDFKEEDHKKASAIMDQTRRAKQ